MNSVCETRKMTFLFIIFYCFATIADVIEIYLYSYCCFSSVPCLKKIFILKIIIISNYPTHYISLLLQFY